MKTGAYIYTDGTRSEELDSSKEVAAVLCNVTDAHEVGVMPVESEDEMEWPAAMDFCKNAGGRCPTIDELTGIYLNKDKINAALKAAGFDEIRDDWYWSSTEYSAGYAWFVYFNSGYRGAPVRYITNYVRPVLAL